MQMACITVGRDKWHNKYSIAEALYGPNRLASAVCTMQLLCANVDNAFATQVIGVLQAYYLQANYFGAYLQCTCTCTCVAFTTQ